MILLTITKSVGHLRGIQSVEETDTAFHYYFKTKENLMSAFLVDKNLRHSEKSLENEQ